MDKNQIDVPDADPWRGLPKTPQPGSRALPWLGWPIALILAGWVLYLLWYPVC